MICRHWKGNKHPKALFTRNVCVCVYVKLRKWVPWQEVMVFILAICIFENGVAKIRTTQTQTLRVNRP